MFYSARPRCKERDLVPISGSRLRYPLVCLAFGGALASPAARADVPLNDPAKADGWAVSTSGQVNAYLSWIFGRTINRAGFGKLIDPKDDPVLGARYRLVGPQVSITGNPV